MRFTLAILLIAVLAPAQAPVKSQAQTRRSPILGFVQAKDVTPIVDTDVYDEQKYVEEVGSDSSTQKAKRAAHEAALTKEFMAGFNQVRECDRVVFQGSGDVKPDFALQIMVDSHDTPGQKPVWNWVLRDVHADKLLPVGSNDSGKDAAMNICLTVQKVANRNGYTSARK